MNPEQYLSDPCGASSLPFWKTDSISIPPSMTILREDKMDAWDGVGIDTPYFKLIHRMKTLPQAELPRGFTLTAASPELIAAHISLCYERERISPAELEDYRTQRIYDAGLWLAVMDDTTGKIAATGIAVLDGKIREGTLEWIQVSPDYRRHGLGRFLVAELLRRMRDKADFATVSGRLNSDSKPCALYLSCGFENPVIWHIIHR